MTAVHCARCGRAIHEVTLPNGTDVYVGGDRPAVRWFPADVTYATWDSRKPVACPADRHGWRYCEPAA